MDTWRNRANPGASSLKSSVSWAQAERRKSDLRREPAKEEPQRILVVDDNLDNVEIIEARLTSRGYLIESAANGEEALRRIHEAPPHLVLLDVMMPLLDGFEVSRRIKRDPSLPFIPVILVTARGETEDKVEGLDAGADDYLTKPINFPELEARVRSMLRIKRLQDELDRNNRQLEDVNRQLTRLSITDGLTGLFNHRHAHELLREEYERCRRSGESMAVIMFDLDQFKELNDTHGHPTGDAILSDTARILLKTAREIDMIGRYGGEEFIAILPGADEDSAARFAERVRATVESHIFRDEGREIRMTISAGVAASQGTELPHPDELIRQADRALYEAKETGRNQAIRSSDLPAGKG
ncbi:MAG: diguanylate cyclase [Gemmatimonadota bacterium]|jgi:diguanylate cyclase (GGDEF)-like protein|nr:diguanylate cyclase [Gemmatimonadota bacterium]